MKFVWHYIDLDLEVFNGKATLLTIEDHKLFEHFLIDLRNCLDKQSELIEMLDDKGNGLKIEKIADLISSPFDLNFAKKELQKKLYTELEFDLSNSEDESKFLEAQSDFLSVIENLSVDSEYALDYKLDFGTTDLLKAFGIELRKPEGNFIEKLVEYIEVVSKLVDKNIFIICNCAAYLGADDYKHLINMAQYRELSIVFVENHEILGVDWYNRKIIDIDLCEI